MRIGIFFGGQSREREISFAGGRTVYDNLNKDIFEAIPIFVDGLGNFILLHWENIYKGTIRDFHPPVNYIPNSARGFQIYVESLKGLSEEEMSALIKEVGTPITPSEFANTIDFAFLALHGPYGEDGNIQGILEWYGVPYSGSGILPSAIGIDKKIQHQLMQKTGFKRPKTEFLNKKSWDWLKPHMKESVFKQSKEELGFPFVIKSPHQGSSLGVSILKEDDFTAFERAVEKSFFREKIDASWWNNATEDEKQLFIYTLTDLRTGVGMPVIADNEITIYHPDELYDFLEQRLTSVETVSLESIDNEENIILEEYIEGKEFSCIVIKNEKEQLIALPPTEIVKKEQLFDYKSKYLPGMSRKVTPIDLPKEQILEICQKSESLCATLNFGVYARIDGFITSNNEIYLNDPNTTSGMLPSSFFFHQAAEIGLNPSEFLTYIIRTSLQERIKTGKKTLSLKHLLQRLDEQIISLQNEAKQKTKIAVLLGGYSTERHISVESGRNIYEKLSSSTKYEPTPIFLTGKEGQHELYKIPINILLKDNADDIKEKIMAQSTEHEVIKHIKEKANSITEKYAQSSLNKAVAIDYDALAKEFDSVFIALHGRPGEDGAVQLELEKRNVPYNGSNVNSSQLTINKFETNELLKSHGILVAKHSLINKAKWEDDKNKYILKIEEQFDYPMIAKPHDDGCSSAVKKIKNRNELIAFGDMMFREEEKFITKHVNTLHLSSNEPFPQKEQFLIEDLIQKGNALHFLEITGGLLTRLVDNKTAYEIFEPSEALASGEVLSLEEKFLAGEGQNITPSRFAKAPISQERISKKVKEVLLKTAQIAGIEGYARIDAFVKIYDNEEVEVYIIEINSLPGMTPATCIFHQTAINGYKPYDFIDAIMTYGKERVESSKG